MPAGPRAHRCAACTVGRPDRRSRWKEGPGPLEPHRSLPFARERLVRPARSRVTGSRRDGAMNINNVYGTTGRLAPTAAAAGDRHAGRRHPRASVASGSGPAATTTLSTPGQLFGELQQLSQQDPAKFKAVATPPNWRPTSQEIAASQATGPQAQFLSPARQPTFTQAAADRDRFNPSAKRAG